MDDPDLDASARPAAGGPDFRLVFETEATFVWNTLRRLGLPDREVEDAAQDVFLVVHRHLRDYDPTRPLRPWLFGICYRVAVAHRRRAHTRNERLGPDSGPFEVASEARPADEQVEAHEAKALVQRALDTLDLDRRAIFLMVEYEGYSMPEIAGTLGIPLNTAYSRLRLAREQFVAAVRRLQAQSEFSRVKARGAAAQGIRGEMPDEARAIARGGAR